MSKFKFSYVLWAVLAAAALFVAACDTGSDSESTSGPGLLKTKPNEPNGPKSLFTKKDKSGDGSSVENAVVYSVTAVKAHAAGTSLDLAGLVDVGEGTANYKIVDVRGEGLGLSSGYGDVPNGRLARPQAPGNVTVRVTNGRTGDRAYLRIEFTPGLPPAEAKETAAGVKVATIENEKTKSVVTIKADKSVELSKLLPSDVADLPFTWTIDKNDENSTEKDNTFSINQLKKGSAAAKAAGEVVTGTLVGVGSSVTGYQPYDGANVHYGTVKLKATVESTLASGTYQYDVVFLGKAGLKPKTATGSGPNVLVFNMSEEQKGDGKVEENAIVVSKWPSGAKSTARAAFSTEPVTLASLTEGHAGALTYEKNNGFVPGFVPVPTASTTVSAPRDKDTLEHVVGDVIVKVSDSGNDTTVQPSTLYFRIPFRKDASTAGLTFKGDARLAAGVPLDVDLDPFTVEDGTKPGVDKSVTGDFDFSYSLKRVVDDEELGRSLGTTSEGKTSYTNNPEPLTGDNELVAGAAYKLVVTATARADSEDYAGTVTETYYFSSLGNDVFSTALAANVGGLTAGIAGTADAANKILKGLTYRAATAKQAPDKAIEVWLKSDYIDSATGKPITNYQAVWEAYTGTASTTSVKTASGPAKGEVLIADSATGATATGRKKVLVGYKSADNTGALAGAGSTVVVSIYKSTASNTGLADTTDRVARYELTITKADAIILNGAQVSANGYAATGANAPTKAQLTGAPITAVPVLKDLTASTPLLANATEGKAKLSLTTAAAVGKKVAFNNFAVTGGKLPNVTWQIKGDDGATSGVAETNVGDGGANGDTAGTHHDTTLVDVAAKTRADFPAVTTDKGQVTLIGTDPYGQSVTITVTLDDGV